MCAVVPAPCVSDGCSGSSWLSYQRRCASVGLPWFGLLSEVMRATANQGRSDDSPSVVQCEHEVVCAAVGTCGHGGVQSLDWSQCWWHQIKGFLYDGDM